ncbi:MAG: ferrous iron transport protein [Clostridia bacterium]|jgi:ferrous iron transport protein A|nr:FeoA family protein [Clostridiales bacterium]MDK2985737.1 ferrous iron transport protein [Clostridia bacterium]
MSEVKIIPLAQLPIRSWGKVHSLLAKDDSRRRLMDLGLVPGTRVEAIRRSPLGDPTAYSIRGATIALRKEEAQKVLVIPTER